MKQKTKITESDFHKIINESVKKVLKEVTDEAIKKNPWIPSSEDDFNNIHYHFCRPMQRIHDMAAHVASNTRYNAFIRDVDIQGAKEILAITSKLGYTTTPDGNYFLKKNRKHYEKSNKIN